MKTLLTALAILLTTATCFAADVKLTWDPSQNATGYRVYMSTDRGQTWDAGVDVGNTTTHTYIGVPDIGLILFRVSAYNSQANSIRYNAGAWYCAEWVPPTVPTGTGVE